MQDELGLALNAILADRCGEISALELLRLAHERTRNVSLKELREEIHAANAGDHATGDFPTRNHAYRTLIALVKRWPKRELHVHVSNSLSPQFISQLLASMAPDDKQAVYKSALRVVNSFVERLDKQSALSDVEAADRQSAVELRNRWNSPARFAEDWSDSVEIAEILRPPPGSRFSHRAGLRDVVILRLQDLTAAICYVAEECFRDGITRLELRFNPYKPELLDFRQGRDGFEEQIENTVRAVSDGLAKAEQKVDDELGRRIGRMVFSFNRRKFRILENQPDNSGLVSRIVSVLGMTRIRACAELAERMVGVDFSGPDDERTEQWNKVLREAGRHGFFRTAHFDSLRLGRQYDTGHVLDALDGLGEVIDHLDRIGHGLPLYCRTEIVSGHPSIARRFLQVRTKVKERGVVIECCPSTNLKSNKIQDYGKHPFHEWEASGFRLGLGIDGLAHWPASLSEEIVRLLLTSPNDLPMRRMWEIATCH